uniref:Major sperm protein n=1 Tax=Loa loa TaxID=7209 RepID=A0A1I7V5W9_LOALO
MFQSNTKSNVTQSSISSSQSLEKISKLPKNKLEASVEKSSSFLSKEKESVNQKKSVSSQSDQKSFQSRKSDQSNEKEWEKGKNDDNTFAKIPEKSSLIVIPMITAEKSKNTEGAKLADGKSISNEETEGAMFKEKEQNTQENIGLMDEKEEQQLTLEPKNLRWNGEGGYQTVQLRNITEDRLAVKAKCSDNHLYRVNPVFGFIDPGQELKVDIIRRKAVPKVDKMIFVSVRANKDDIFPKPLFKRSKDSQKMAMLPLLITRVI